VKSAEKVAFLQPNRHWESHYCDLFGVAFGESALSYPLRLIPKALIFRNSVLL
jgi:hypothetical protein